MAPDDEQPEGGRDECDERATSSLTISTPRDSSVPYQFPDNSRRRIPGVIYLGLAAACAIAYLAADGSPS